MPKYGMKLEFKDKVSLFGMPKSLDWALIANFGDKTHLRNYMMTRLSEWLGAKYTPRMQFVELYLNREYKGLYLLSETVKVAKNRVDIAQNDTTFLVEKEDSKKFDPPYVLSDHDYYYHIKSPKNPSEKTQQLLLDHLNAFESYVMNQYLYEDGVIRRWLDVNDYVLYYWVQEYSKNEDGNYARSVFFTWTKGEPIHFGPLWDFDLGFGNESREKFAMPENWFIRNYRWNRYILMDARMQEMAKEYWTAHRETFHELIDSIPLYKSQIEKAAKNDIKRWPILDNTFLWALRHSYDSYDEAVDSMTVWMKKRFQWIEDNL
jgi:hypothetical protein